MRIVDEVSGFVRIGHRDRFRLAAAWSLLGFSRLLILLVPFRVVRRLLGEHRPAAEPVFFAVNQLELARAERIGVIVQVAARHTPWKSECYPQALTARAFLVLRRIPHQVCFGLRREDGELVAHAWVLVADVPVVGGDGSDYTEVGSFVWLPRGRR